jgi:hypothetical protein
VEDSFVDTESLYKMEKRLSETKESRADADQVFDQRVTHPPNITAAIS